jgi:hypothetical protein
MLSFQDLLQASLLFAVIRRWRQSQFFFNIFEFGEIFDIGYIIVPTSCNTLSRPL